MKCRSESGSSPPMIDIIISASCKTFYCYKITTTELSSTLFVIFISFFHSFIHFLYSFCTTIDFIFVSLIALPFVAFRLGRYLHTPLHCRLHSLCIGEWIGAFVHPLAVLICLESSHYTGTWQCTFKGLRCSITLEGSGVKPVVLAYIHCWSWPLCFLWRRVWVVGCELSIVNCVRVYKTCS